MSDTKELLKKIVQHIASLRREIVESKEEVMAAIENGIRTIPKKFNELDNLISRIMATDENLRELYNLLYTVHTPSSNERKRLAVEFIAKEQYIDENGELQKQLVSAINTWLSHHRWSWKDKITKEWNASPQTFSEDNIFHIAKRARDQFMQSAPPPSAAEKTQVKQIIQKIALNNSPNNASNNNNNKKKTNNSNIEADQTKSTKKRKINDISNNNNTGNNKTKKKTKKQKTRQIRSDEESGEESETSLSVGE